MPWVILSVALAMVLDAVALSPAVQPWNPPWTLLVLVYWCWTLPDRIGTFAGFCVGLLVDAMHGGLLGLHALAASLLAYLATLARPVFSAASIGQQTIVVWLLVLVYRLAAGWLASLSGEVNLGWTYWLSTLSVLFAWPLVYTLLKELTPVRRRL